MIELETQAIHFYTDTLFELSLARQDVEFESGDCVAIFNAENVSRPYSIAAGTEEDRLRFLIRRLPGGKVSEWLARRKPGDPVQISPPFGWFRPGQAGGKSIFFATGTGIAPFLSYLRSAENSADVQCFYGCRRFDETLERDYLRDKCKLTLAISREQIDHHHHGRVTDFLEELPLDENTNYYLCGLDAMINQVTDWLEDHGVDFTRIHREVFFHATEAE